MASETKVASLKQEKSVGGNVKAIKKANSLIVAARFTADESKNPAKKTTTGLNPNHPPYLEMTISAIETLKERTGSSRAAILKYIMANFDVIGEKNMINVHVKQALKRGVATNKLVNTKVPYHHTYSFLSPVLSCNIFPLWYL